MRKTELLDLSVGEIMSMWPSTIRIFIEHNMHCVGCPISPFHTLPDAAEEHGLAVATLAAEIEREIESAGLKGSRASAHRR